MKKYLILFIVTTTFFCSSFKSNESHDDEKLFSEILGRFSEVDTKIAKLGSENSKTPPKTFNEAKERLISQLKLIEEYKPVIEDSKEISDKYLDEIHPQMKTMFRDSLVGSYSMSLEIISEFNIMDIEKDGYSDKFLVDMAAKNAKILKMRHSFFSFISQNNSSVKKVGFLGYVMNFIAFMVSVIFGTFAWSSILIPVFVVIPRSIKRRGKIPFSTLIPVIFWSLILYFGTTYFLEWQPNLYWGVIVGLSLSALNIIKKAFFGGQDLEHDIKDTYGEDLSNVN